MVVIRNLALVLVLAASVSCNYNRQKEEAGPGGGVGTRDLGPLNYLTVNQTVIAPQCLNCHSNQTGNKGNLNLETYQSVRANLNRIAFRSLEKRDMPPQGLPSGETAILKAWIEAGAPEQLSGPSEKPGGELDQGPAGFAKVRDHIFAAKCLDCHSGVNPQGALDLTSLAEVRMKITKIFESVIVKQTMPIEPYPALSPKERKVLLNWIDLGMPE